MAELSPTKQALLAKWLKAEKAERRIPKRGSAGPAPLTFAQQRLWFIHNMEPEASVAYNIPLGLHVKGPLSAALLRESLIAVAARHESLRTRIVEQDGVPMQMIDPPQIDVLTVDLRALPTAQRFDAALALAGQEARRRMDLSAAHPARYVLVQLDEADHLLIVVIHHIVADAWSLGVFVDDLMAAYRAGLSGSSVALPPLEVSYADFSTWQRDNAEGYTRQLSYWLSQLSGAATLDLPTDKPRPPHPDPGGAAHTMTIARSTLDALNALARAQGCTLYMVLLAAFDVVLSRLAAQDDVVVGTPVAGRTFAELQRTVGFFANTLAIRCDLSGDPTFTELLERVRAVVMGALANQDVPFEAIVDGLKLRRDTSRSALFQVVFALQNVPPASAPPSGPLEVSQVVIEDRTAKFDLWLSMHETSAGLLATYEYRTDLFEADSIERLAGYVEHVLSELIANPMRRLSDIALMPDKAQQNLLKRWNDTALDYAAGQSIADQFERQVARTPDAIALAFEDQQFTYAQVNARANALAQVLRKQGVAADAAVPICLTRSPDMVIGLLAILKAGAAYAPLDPDYPAERWGFVLDDLAQAATQLGRPLVLLTEHQLKARFLTDGIRSDVHVVCTDEATADVEDNPTRDAAPDQADYIIYTSGSTGRPKGVVVTQRNVANFFAAMDAKLGTQPNRKAGTWLAVTSMSFDISVLELLWTLARGYKVVLQGELMDAPRRTSRPATRTMDLGLFYFASEATHASGGAGNAYSLLLDGARFADTHGFSSVWTPERHFHAFGGVYANPAVTSAAIAACTSRVRIHAGSVVLPLHNPVRVAEEWAMIDQLSGGRAGIAIASGWHADDFVLNPAGYDDRKAVTQQGIAMLRQLWRGEPVMLPGVGGRPTPIRTFPRPVQAELPLWLTTSGNPETFRLAGALGMGVLTHLLGQRLDDVAANIRLYREAWQAEGHAGQGHVTLMMHTYLGEDAARTRETARGPMVQYLRSSLDLIRNLGRTLGMDIDAANFSTADMDALLNHAFERYYEGSGLLGTPTAVRDMLANVSEIGVDEVGCLIDFGIAHEEVMRSLTLLAEVNAAMKAVTKAPVSTTYEHAADYSIAANLERHGCTHLQCTPSLAGLLLDDARTVQALAMLDTMLVGGEALPTALAARLQSLGIRHVLNMYGPTETTVWSTSHEVISASGAIPIGRPIANTQVYVLDAQLRPQPPGVTGELYIGGDGVTRGYLGRPDLTAERFIPDAFSGAMGARLYRTGDLARISIDGVLEFLGRADHQVKVHGHRIELGEIETALMRQPEVREAAVVARIAPTGGQRLVAYLVVSEALRALDPEAQTQTLRTHLQALLPAYMLPGAYVVLDAMPRTPNQKLDRKALPDPAEVAPMISVSYAPPHTAAERVLAAVWCELLGVQRVGLHDNFFDLGGDSIVSLQLLSRARKRGLRFQLAQLFQHQTLGALAAVSVLEAQALEYEAPAPVAASPTEMQDADGAFPLLPFPKWFFELELVEPHQWNQAILFETTQRPDLRALSRALATVIEHHAALRSRFVRRGEAWWQVIEAQEASAPLSVIDLSNVPTTALTQTMEVCFDALQRSLQLQRGPLVRAVWVDLGPDRAGRFYMIAHHLVVDGVSWRVIIEDLQTAYIQHLQGGVPKLPADSASLQDWTQAVQRHTQTQDVIAETDYWLSQRNAVPARLPTDFVEGNGLEGSVVFKVVRLSAEETQRLLTQTLPALRVRINDVLVAALALALNTWTKENHLLIDLEGHGRAPVGEVDDVTRTVGWLATYYPVWLDVPASQDMAETLAAVQTRLAQIPALGSGFGWLRTFHPSAEIRAALNALPRAELRFNYLGQFNRMFDPNAPFRAAAESIGFTRGVNNTRPYLIEVNGGIFDGQLELAWVYSTQRHTRATIERVANDMIAALRALNEMAATQSKSLTSLYPNTAKP